MMKKSRKIIYLSILLFNFSMVEHVAASTAKAPSIIEKVIQLYKQSASQNIAQAQFNLGQIYSSELFGYLDLDEANKWYKLAEENGYKIEEEKN